MVDLGRTRRGDPVYMNKYVFECDIPILVGHVQGNPYGGYSGGYKHSASYYKLEEYCQPPCSICYAQKRLHTGKWCKLNEE